MNLSKFSETVKELMYERNLNGKQLGLEIGVAGPTITRYIQGKRMPDIKILVLIADYFNCSTDFLLGREPDTASLKFKKCPPFTEQIEFLAKHFSPNYNAFYSKANIHESTFYEWKNGNSIPSLESIIKIAETFDCRVDFVLGRES